jgi:transglutaminase-like putative cysteine protease
MSGWLLVAVLAAAPTIDGEQVSFTDAGREPEASERPVAVLAGLSPDDERSVATLGAFFAKVPGEAARVRAVHDWLVTRLSYSAAPQAQREAVVLRRRTANCDGYARLFEAVGRAAGLEVETVVGLARDTQGRAQAHAWNAVRVEGRWQLVDVTFDDPQLGGSLTGDEGYRTDYLLITPALARLDHRPDDPRWWLGEPPLSRAQFLAQGPERAPTRRLGLSLEPTRVEGQAVVVTVRNPDERFLLLRVDGARCGALLHDAHAQWRCPLAPGPHHLELLSHTSDTGLFRSAAEWLLP